MQWIEPMNGTEYFFMGQFSNYVLIFGDRNETVEDFVSVSQKNV